MSSDIDRVSYFLKSRSLHASRLWVEGCVEYFKSQQSGSQISIFDLQNFAFDQWLLVDLRSMEMGSLPHNLCSLKDITLSGTYAVQVECVRDVSVPAYSQLLLVRGVSTENTEATKKQAETWEPKPGRVLRLTLFDGIQETVGMEYSPIREIDKGLTPGTKMLIIGPVRCRKGIFLLEQRNVKILGGEVDTLITVNALENVLARALKLPENPDPYGIHGNAVEVMDVDEGVQRELPVSRQQPAPVPASNHQQNDLDFPDDDELDYLDLAEIPDRNQHVPNNNKEEAEEVLLDDEDDDLLLQLPDGQLDSQVVNSQPDVIQRADNEHYVNRPSSTAANEWPSTSRMIHKEAEVMTSKTSLMSTHFTVSNQKSGPHGQGKILQYIHKTSDADTPRGGERKDEIHLKWSSASDPKVIKAGPFVYLKQLVSSLSAPGVYSVKGFLVTLLSKLEEKDGHWSLQAKLSDGSATAIVDFSEEVLDDIVGFSVTELHAMRRKMSGNPAIKERLKNGFQQAKKKLYNLNCIFQLQYIPNSDSHTILHIDDISLKHLAMMKSRSWE